MDKRDHIKDVFREKLEGFEGEVRPDIWNSISSNITSTSAVTTSLFSSKGIISATLLSFGILSTYFLMKDQPSSVNNIKEGRAVNKQFEEKIAKQDKIKNSERHVGLISEDVFTEKNQNLILEPAIFTEPITIENQSNTVSTKESEPSIVVGDEEAKQVVLPETNNQAEIKVSQDVIETTTATPSAKIEDLPNVFTPNSDGVNDFLEIKSTDLKAFSVVVLDATNKIIFSSQDPLFVWDGRLMNGEEAPAGNYIYYVTAKDSQGGSVARSSVLLIRR